MSRLADTALDVKPFPTGVEGLYVRNAEFEEFQKFLEVQAKDEEKGVPASVIVWRIYDRFICDEKGDRFEDFPKPGDHKGMSLKLISGISREFGEFCSGLGKRLA